MTKATKETKTSTSTSTKTEKPMPTTNAVPTMTSNLAAAIRNLVNAPLELLRFAAELFNGVTTLSLSLIRQLPTSAKEILMISFEFGVGVMNPNASDKELAAIIANASASRFLTGIRQVAAERGQQLSKGIQNELRGL